jgi:molecular chaperone DnaK
MQKDAEMHAAEDAKRKEDIAEAKNIAEQLIYTSEKALKDAGDKVPADLKTNVEAKRKLQLSFQMSCKKLVSI